MALATDNVRYSRRPNRWRITTLVLSAAVLAMGWLIFSFVALGVAHQVLLLNLSQTQTFVFLMLVFTGQANVYLARERGHFWTSRPSKWIFLSTVVDITLVSAMAVFGVLMTPVPLIHIVGLAIATLVFMGVLDAVKADAFRRLQLGD